MCVKIVKNQQEIPYDLSQPLEVQIKGCDQIIVNYEPFDPQIEKLLSEMDRFSQTGVDAKINIKVVHNNHVFGVKIRKKLKKSTNDITLNEIIKLMALTYAETDKKLEELANCCTGANCNVK